MPWWGLSCIDIIKNVDLNETKQLSRWGQAAFKISHQSVVFLVNLQWHCWLLLSSQNVACKYGALSEYSRTLLTRTPKGKKTVRVSGVSSNRLDWKFAVLLIISCWFSALQCINKYSGNLTYFIRNGNIIMLFMIKRYLFVVPIKIKLLSRC